MTEPTPLTHDQMVGIINAGGSVSFAFKTITKVADVPSDAEIDAWYVQQQKQRYITEDQADAMYAPVGGSGTTLDAIPAPVADVLMAGFKLRNLGAPISSNDAVRLTDLLAQKYITTYKAPVRVATNGDTVLSGAQAIDGVSAVAGDRVLVKAQNTASQNGIYVVASGAWQRSVDAAAPSGLLGGSYVVVNEGTLNADTVWELTTDDPITVGTTALVFSQATGGSGGAKFAWVWANDAARAATLAAMTDADLNKIGWQQDTNLTYTAIKLTGVYHLINTAGAPISGDDSDSVSMLYIIYIETPPGGLTDQGFGQAGLNFLVPANNLTDVPDPVAARAALGVASGVDVVAMRSFM